jgi:hypothetical protein
MAWTTPRTWTTGETVTAAMLNEQVRDNENYLYGLLPAKYALGNSDAAGYWVQAGSVQTNSNGTAVTFPTAFVSALRAVLVTSSTTYLSYVGNVTLTGFNAYIGTSGGALAIVYWLAIGK